jgi:hypothetical protein
MDTISVSAPISASLDFCFVFLVCAGTVPICTFVYLWSYLWQGPKKADLTSDHSLFWLFRFRE